jgi:hypothetical protein
VAITTKNQREDRAAPEEGRRHHRHHHGRHRGWDKHD